MHVFDKNLKKLWPNFIFQSLLAVMALLIVFIFLDFFTDAVVIAALGSTAFVVFTLPSSPTAQPRNVIGCYIIAVLAGIFCNYLAYLNLSSGLSLPLEHPVILFGALAVGITIFLSLITDTEHAAAAGAALGIAAQGWSWNTIGVILSSVILISILHNLLKPVLRDLL